MKSIGGPGQDSAKLSVNGAYPENLPSPQPESTSILSAKTGHTDQSTSAHNREELSFQFDRHVQEIRRRKTAIKKGTPPDRSEFIEVGLYTQAVSARGWLVTTVFVVTQQPNQHATKFLHINNCAWALACIQ